MHKMRNRVWGSLSNFVFKAYVMDAMIMRYQKYDKRINIWLAIVSSSSIATWTVWHIVPQLWAGIIAVTQVIQAVKPYFPYSKYIRTLNEKSKLLHDTNRRFERLFFNIDNKKLTTDEIADQYFNLKAEAENVCFFGDDMNIAPKESDIEYANQETAAYLKSNYNV